MKKIFLLAILLSIFFIALNTKDLRAATYYVAQTSSGIGDGRNFSNRMSVSSHNSGSINPGDTIYLCDTIKSRISVPSSGTSGNYITYRGDYAGHAGVINYESSGSSMFNTNSKNYLIIQSITFDGDNGGGAIGIGVNSSDHVTIKKCTIYETTIKGIYLKGANTNIVIGGASGDGNEIYNVGQDTGGTDISLGSGVNVVISYNKLYATAPWAFGIDGIATHNSSNVLIEYNTIYSHNKVGGESGEDGIDLKEKSHDITIRYNHIYGHTGQSGVTVQLGSYDVDIYGNSIHDNRWAGVYIKRGNEYKRSAHDVENIYVWSNLIYKNASGVMVASSGRSEYKISNVYIYNNTIAENGNKGPTQGTGVMLQYGTGHIIKNNIFYKNTDDTADSIPYQQVDISNGVTATLDYNTYYYPGASRKDMFTVGKTDHTFTKLKGLGYETHGVYADPKFTDADSHDYTLASDSPCINAGTDLSLSLTYAEAIDPDQTDFNAYPPLVGKENRSDHGSWDIGAYIYKNSDETTVNKGTDETTVNKGTDETTVNKGTDGTTIKAPENFKIET